MKKIAGLVCVIAGIAVIASCGGGSTSPEQAAINSSASALSDIMDYVEDNCLAFPCACPGGGTIDFDGITFTADACKASNGETFTGTLTDNGDSVTASFAVFGECTAVSGTITGIDEDNCSGTLTGACADTSVTCSMSSDCEKCNI